MAELVDKLRGGYYTPGEVARFICDWAVSSKTSSVLEPSCGDGVFIEAAHRRLASLGSPSPSDQIVGVELYPGEAEKAAQRGARVECGDFFTLCRGDVGSRRYDAIVGNPPFIRYQDFVEEYRSTAFELMREYGFSPNRLTNIWLPFLVVCCHLLSDEGRLGMVIPAELFQVKYAAEARRFLTDYFARVTVVTFSELLFDGAQQEVVLLLAERSSGRDRQGVRMIEAIDADSLKGLTPTRLKRTPLKHKLPESMKWQAYYLDGKALDLMAELSKVSEVVLAESLFDVNVGVVSGQNSFFVIDEKTAVEHGVRESCEPIISRAFQLNGLVLSEEDFERQLGLGRKVLLFLPDAGLNEAEARYVEMGEALSVSENYKCRIRRPWYKVPTSWKPDAFFYRQVGAYPRIVINEKRAHTTDTLHKVRFKDGVDGKSVAVAFNNSLTFAVSELTGRSYGGGVLTFEPSEARILPIPFDCCMEFDFEKADALVRGGNPEKLLDYVDNVQLIKGIGLSKHDAILLRESWSMLRDRRLARKKR